MTKNWNILDFIIDFIWNFDQDFPEYSIEVLNLTINF